MLRDASFAIKVVSVYLLIYLIVIVGGYSLRLALLMFSVSPVLLAWMFYIVIRYGSYKGRELKEDEEWAYLDRDTE